MLRALGYKGLVVSFEPVEERRTSSWPSQGSSAIAAAGLPSSVGGHWRMLAQFPSDELLARWLQIVDGQPADGTCWSPVGPFLELAPLGWCTWDPDECFARSASLE